MAAPTHVAVVVLTWNGREDTLACLRSLERVTHEPLTVVVVDAASADGTVDAVRAAHPRVEVVALDRNLGFAGGNNAGIRRALELGAGAVLVLNNDVEVDPGFVTALLDELEARPGAGSLCPKILYFDPPDRIWFAGAAFDPRAGYQGRMTGHGETDGPAWSEVRETDRACGAAMLVPRDVLERVGLFDERLFLYAEDTDWSLRARAAGYRHFVVPASRVWHKVSAASGGENAPATIYYDLRNLLAVCERHAPLGRLGTWRRRAVLVAAHAAQGLLSRRRRAALRAVWDAWRDFRRGRLGPREAAA